MNANRSALRAALAVVVLAGLAGGPTLAQTSTWDGQGGASSNWSNAVNWVGNTTPTANQRLVFVSSSYTGGQLSVLDTAFGNYSASGLLFNGGWSGTFELRADAGRTLTVAGGALTSTANVRVGTAAGNLLISAPLAGSATVFLQGNDLLTLSGTNSYTGGTVIQFGTVSVSSDANLGAASGGITLQGGNDSGIATLRATNSFSTGRTLTLDAGVSAVSPFLNGGAIEVTNFSTLTLGVLGVPNATGAVTNTAAGLGNLIKRGNGSLRLNSAANTFYGSVTIEDGNLDFISYEARATALRSMPLIFSTANGAVRNLVGGDLDPTHLRTGEISGTAGLLDLSGGTQRGDGLSVQALADANFGGTVSLSTATQLRVSGIATQTFSGTMGSAAIGPESMITRGAGLTLAGNASLDGANTNADFWVEGGTLTLDNTGTNLASRLPSGSASAVDLSGGTLVLLGNGSANTVETIGILATFSGANTVRVTAAPGRLATLHGDFIGRNGGTTGTYNYELNAGAAVVMNIAPPMGVGILGRQDNGLGYATVNGTDWATYGTGGVTAFTAYTDVGPALPAGSTNTNGRLDGGAATPAGGTAFNTLKIIADNGNEALDVTGAGHLSTRAILMTGNGNYNIRQAAGASGGLLSPTQMVVRVADPAGMLTISTPLLVNNNGAPDAAFDDFIKTGPGTLSLTRTSGGSNVFPRLTTFAINEGALRVVPDGFGTNVSLPSLNTVIDLRGGVLELPGSPAGPLTFSRTVGTGSGQINWTGGGGGNLGSGGFAAVGSRVDVNLGASLSWNAGEFVATGQALVFGSATSNAELRMVNGFSLGSSLTPGYELREVRVNAGLPGSIARVTGPITSGTNGQWFDLLKTGPGTLALAGNNSYAGGTIVAEGTLQLEHANALGGGGPYVFVGNRNGAAAAALVTNAAVTVTRPISVQAGAGTRTLGGVGNVASTFAGDIRLFKDVQLTSASTTFANRTEFGGVISGRHLVTKVGPGVLSLTGANEFRNGTTDTIFGLVGAVVSQGTLLVNNTAGNGTGIHRVRVDSGGTLGGTGNAGGGVAVANGGILAPGNLGVGTLESTLRLSGGATANGFVGLDGGAIYAWELATAGSSSTTPGGSTTAPGTQHDFVQVTGNIVLGDNAADTMIVRPINLAGSGFNPALPYSWRIMSGTQPVGITGTVAVDPVNFGDLAGGTFLVSASGNDLYLNFTPVPEPAGVLLFAVGGWAGAAAWRRRRGSRVG